MKVLSLKEVDNYMYCTVIVPLKDLQVDPIGRNSSPLTQKDGKPVVFQVTRQEVTVLDAQHNFQRNQGRAMAKWIVIMGSRYGGGAVCATYEPKHHKVLVHKRAFREQFKNDLVLNRFVDAFIYHTPFGEVKLTNSAGSARLIIPVSELRF